ncbi:MAG: 3-deoxy-D-manno-octulosonic acid transferase [Candidatus Omnitrophica bacterium]|nr:3-deoxy-D-manno-octulosonic acid transferase [Candidatus Omnitrophota bacterium]
MMQEKHDERVDRKILWISPWKKLFLSFLGDLAFIFFGVFYLPVFLTKISQAQSRWALIKERLGFLPDPLRQSIRAKKILWIHAVSVGEVMAAKLFIEKWTEKDQTPHLVLTTVTPTGQKIAKGLESPSVSVCYFPFDLSWVVRRFIRILKPVCLLLLETELWPNLLLESQRAGVPVGVLNGRLSPHSTKQYRRFGFLFKPLFESLSFVCTQTDEDQDRYIHCGVEPERVQILGNMKFDQIALMEKQEDDQDELRSKWHFSSEDRVWIAGSTHPGEEEKILQVFNQVRENQQLLKLLIAPRHIERAKKLAKLAAKKGFRVWLTSDTRPAGDFDVVVLDRLGVLKHLYALANVVFVGGSFVSRGGQNPIEPASFRKPILHGPHTFNFARIYHVLDQEGGALMVKDTEQLQFALKRLLEDVREGQQIGDRAYEIVKKLQGATERHVGWVLDFLAPALKERIHDVQRNAKLFSPTGRRM